jgi:hypothetical protein
MRRRRHFSLLRRRTTPPNHQLTLSSLIFWAGPTQLVLIDWPKTKEVDSVCVFSSQLKFFCLDFYFLIMGFYYLEFKYYIWPLYSNHAHSQNTQDLHSAKSIYNSLSIIFWLASGKYKIVSWKKKSLKASKISSFFLRLYFVIAGDGLYISTMYRSLL